MKKQHSNVQRRRGAVLVLCVFVLIALLTVIAVSMNISWIQFKRLQAQSAADLGSLSAMNHFARDSALNDPAPSRLIGAQVVALNEGNPIAEPNRIRFGFLSDPTTHAPQFFEDELQVDAAKVQRSSNPTEVPLFLGAFLGQSVHEVSAEAVSTYPLEVVLCLDASRSMTRLPDQTLPPGIPNIHHPPLPTSRWDVLTQTVDNFLLQLSQINPYARVGLVTFGGGFPPHPHLGLSPLDDDPARTELGFQLAESSDVKQVMDSYAALPRLGLGTYIYDGIQHSELLMQNHGNGRAVRVIILLSDGRQAVSADGAGTRPAPFMAVQWSKANGVPIHTINFQTVENPPLDEVANESGGLSLDATDSEGLETAFDQLLNVLESRLAR